MAGRPAGLSEDEAEEFEDDFFPTNNSVTSIAEPVIRSRLNSRSPALSNAKQPPNRADVDLDELRLAALKGRLDKVRLLLQRIPVDQVLRSGWTALMYAASGGQWKVVEYLLENGANPNFHKELFTPLMAACASSSDNEDDLTSTVEALLKNGAKVNAAERHRVTPLMFSSKERRLKLVKALLANGADPNLQDNRGWTALMWAAERGDGAIVRELMGHGDGTTDIHLISLAGQKAAEIALAANHKEIAALLDNAQQKPGSLQSTALLEPVFDFTELETALMGLDAAELIPTFHQHKMNYRSFLLLDEEDLDKMDITKVGDRTKLLCAVKEIHTQKWKRQSLPQIQYSKYLSCPEATALVGNLALHGRYMEASVAYLRDQIQRRPRILQLGMETASVHALAAQTNFAMKHIQGLQDQLRYLKLYLDKVQDKSEFVPADLITEKKGDTSRSFSQRSVSWIRYLALFMVVLTGGVALWRSPALFTQRSPTAVLLVV